MSYTYPDKNDMLTCQLIDTEFDAKYWGESEEEVLHQAMEEVDHLAENGVRKDSLSHCWIWDVVWDACSRYMHRRWMKLQQQNRMKNAGRLQWRTLQKQAGRPELRSM